MKIKLVRNTRSYGTFGVSREAVLRLRQLGYQPAIETCISGEKFPDGTVNDQTDYESYLYEMDRMDPLLIQVVTELGAKANGSSSELVIETYELSLNFGPRDDCEYDGMEHSPYAHLRPARD